MDTGWIDDIFTIISVFSTLMAAVVIYVVIFHSPSTMKGYTRFIINYTAWDFLFSLNLGGLVKPQIIPPFNGCLVNGWFRLLGPYWAPMISLVSIVNTGGNSLATQVICLVYRFIVIHNNPYLVRMTASTSTWIIGYVIGISIGVSTYFIFGPVLVFGQQMIDMINIVAQKFPNATKPALNGNPIIYADADGVYAFYSITFVIVGFFIAEFASMIAVFLLLKLLESKKASFSKATYKLQRQLIIALGIQLLTPFLFIVLPCTYGITLIYPVVLIDDATAGLIINYIELYGTSNSIVTLCFIKPYRVYVIGKFRQLLRFTTCGRLGREEDIVLVLPPESTINSAAMQ